MCCIEEILWASASRMGSIKSYHKKVSHWASLIGKLKTWYMEYQKKCKWK